MTTPCRARRVQGRCRGHVASVGRVHLRRAELELVIERSVVTVSLGLVLELTVVLFLLLFCFFHSEWPDFVIRSSLALMD